MARKKTVKPTLAEARKLKARLQRQYPQMFESVAGAAQKKQITRAAPTDQKKLLRMVGMKLKKIYKSK